MDSPEHVALKRQRDRLEQVRKKRLLMESEVSHIHNRQQDVEEQMRKRSGNFTEAQDKVLEKLGHAPRFHHEAVRTYGSKAKQRVVDAYAASPDGSRAPALPVMGDVMKNRNALHRDHAKHHEEYIRQLNEERHRLVEQREFLRQKRTTLQPDRVTPVSPTPSNRLSPITARRLPSRESTLSVQSDYQYIHNTHSRIPQLERRVLRLRDEYAAEWHRRKKPYNGELGLHSYRPDQMDAYYLCRSLVDEVVERFLNMYFRKDDSQFEPGIRLPSPESVVSSAGSSSRLSTARTSSQASSVTGSRRSTPSVERRQREKLRKVRAENERQLDQARKALHIAQAINLLREELVLEVTGELAEECAYEFFHIREFSDFRTVTSLYKFIEHRATGAEKGREPTEADYDTVTRFYKNVLNTRETKKRNVWKHTQVTEQQEIEASRPQGKTVSPEEIEKLSKKCVIS